VLLAAWLRVPYVTRGMPFFYEQDEAHHFHRTVQMVKDGSFHPKYFNKPSLHFYLRMPVVAAAFIAAAKDGEIRRVDELVTRRAGERGGWAFTASHPRVAVWNRTFGVALGLLVLLPVFAIARTLTGSDTLALGAILLTAVSPALAADAAKVGVDTPLVLMCLLAMWLALRLHERFSIGRLLAAGLVAGLAISTKYNAAPIALVPLAAVLASGRRSAGALIVALVAPGAGFLAGTPYAVISLPEFLNGIAFEAWHYGTAGHGYATGTPGLPQAWYYLRWFSSSAAVGLLAVMLAGAGLVVLARRRDPRAVTVLLFPVAFFALMAAQKVNFTRNVLVLIPVMAVLAAVAVSGLAPPARRFALALLVLAAVQPAVQAVRASRPIPPDSRLVAGTWLERVSGPRAETVVTVDVGWPRIGPGTRNVTMADRGSLDPVALYMQGFDRVITRAPLEDASGSVREEQIIAGSRTDAEIPVSPELRIYRIGEPLEAAVGAWLARPQAQVAPPVRYGSGESRRISDATACWDGQSDDGSAGDVGGDCWLPGRASRLRLDPASLPRDAMTLRAKLYSPWPNQRCALAVGAWRSADLCEGRSAAEWFAVEVELPAADLRREGALTVRVQEVHARPVGRGRTIRTGLAVGGVALLR
jgi:hypothetical protein